MQFSDTATSGKVDEESPGVISSPNPIEGNDQLTEKIVSGLVQLGLTHCQAKVYTAVIKLGSASARAIAKECSIDRGSTYHTVEELVKLDLLKEELGTPNMYSLRNTGRTLRKLVNRYKSELDLKIQTASQVASEAEKLKVYQNELKARGDAPIYRLLRNREQRMKEVLKLWRETKGEILWIGPARAASRMTNDLFGPLKESVERGVVWRCIIEITETNKEDVRKMSKYCQIREHPRLPMLMCICDRKAVAFGATPTYLANMDREDEPHIIFDDPASADVFALFFESLWKTSKKIEIDPVSAVPVNRNKSN